jgi:hypothetical protein
MTPEQAFEYGLLLGKLEQAIELNKALITAIQGDI